MRRYMEPFEPVPGMTLTINGSAYIFQRDPAFIGDSVVYARQGTEATIYQMREQMTGSLWALKVFHPGFNAPQIAAESAALGRYAGLPGLACARRYCLTQSNAPEVISRFPALEHAILMPWIQGHLWAAFMLTRAAAQSYTADAALSLARALAISLSHLEASGAAHTDIGGGNILFSPTWDRIELVDIERMFLPGAPQPLIVSNGSPGYAFPHQDRRGQWRPDGDRFAGAMALVEMLAWADPDVRAATPEESETLFDEHDLLSLECQRWSLARDAVWALCPPALDLFDQTWSANDLADCPPLATWAHALNV